MQSPPKDDDTSASRSIDEEVVRTYLSLIQGLSDELCLPQYLTRIVESILKNYPAPVGNPDALLACAQTYKNARDSAVAARTVLVQTQGRLLDIWTGKTGDAIQEAVDTLTNKLTMVIDNYQVSSLVLADYRGKVRSAQWQDDRGRYLLREALAMLAPLPQRTGLQDTSVHAVLPRARDLAESACDTMLAGTMALRMATDSAKDRLNVQMNRSIAVIGGSLPDTTGLGPFSPPPALSPPFSPRSASSPPAGLPAETAPGTSSVDAIPGNPPDLVGPAIGDGLLPITVAPSPLSPIPRRPAVPSSGTIGSPRKQGDQPATVRSAGTEEIPTVWATPDADSPAPIPSPSPGPSPTPRSNEASAGR